MSKNDSNVAGSVASLWRYPVKSMQGEELVNGTVTPRGMAGDRTFALLDKTEGHVVSAKNPRKWPKVLDLKATLLQADANSPAVEIRLPDGSAVNSNQEQCDQMLSEYLGREVTITCSAPSEPRFQQFWPDEDKTTDELMPSGTFFDVGWLHLVTTATLRRLQELYPAGDFSVPRFRPNLVIDTPPELEGFVENDWVGLEVGVGDSARLKIISRTERCVMTTLSQPMLNADPDILRTAAAHNEAAVGVYAQVIAPGSIERGALVQIS